MSQNGGAVEFYPDNIEKWCKIRPSQQIVIILESVIDKTVTLEIRSTINMSGEKYCEGAEAT